MARVRVTEKAREYMLSRGGEYTIYQVYTGGGSHGGYREPALGQGRPGNLERYFIRHFSGLKIYVSSSLVSKSLTIDLGSFLTWHWLTVEEGCF